MLYILYLVIVPVSMFINAHSKIFRLCLIIETGKVYVQNKLVIIPLAYNSLI